MAAGTARADGSMPRLSFVEDSDSSESNDDATAANEADSSSHATGAAASLSQPEDAHQANTAPAPSGGSAAQLRQRATERWEHLRTLTKDERLKCALSPAAAEVAAEAEGLCLVRAPGTKSGFKNVTLADSGRQFRFAAFMPDGKQKILIGYYLAAEEAALACALAHPNPSTSLCPTATHAHLTVRQASPHLIAPPVHRRALDRARGEPQAGQCRRECRRAAPSAQCHRGASPLHPPLFTSP